MILPWSFRDPTLILLWSFHDPSVIWPWSYRDLTTILFRSLLIPQWPWQIWHWRSFQIFKEIMTTIQRPPITSKTRSASPEKRHVLYDDLPNKAKSASPSKRIREFTSCLGQQRNSDISNITGGHHVLLSSWVVRWVTWLNWLKTTTFLINGGFFEVKPKMLKLRKGI